MAAATKSVPSKIEAILVAKFGNKKKKEFITCGTGYL
jgi:hypothetical protein